MEQIIKPDQRVMCILGENRQTETVYRMIRYAVARKIEEGVLLLNVLTRELLLLSEEEYENHRESAYLREHWFVIPESVDEKEFADLVKWVLLRMRAKQKETTNYTILTTTECNARCFYCYEKGYARVSMSEKTADRVVTFIKEQCGRKKVKLTWFGGEPLVNDRIIDRICRGLRAQKIDFVSSMISNGYLFDGDRISRAKELWDLRAVQITLDGTEEKYNRIKAFVYQGKNPYKVVKSNIAGLLHAGIRVKIRLNVDIHNTEDILILADELIADFKGEKGLSVYAHLLFDAEGGEHRTHAQQRQLHDIMQRLEQKLCMHNMSIEGKSGLKRSFPENMCMADSGNSVVIVPDGHLGLCEHYIESEFIGHIDTPQWDQGKIDSWRERQEELAECKDCFYYPECIKLRKCVGSDVCTEWKREALRRRTELGMKNEFSSWRVHTLAEEKPDDRPDELKNRGEDGSIL